MIAKPSPSQHAQNSVVESSLSGPVFVSICLHILIAAVVLFGAPHFIDDAVVYDQPITIEIADIDQITQTDRAPLDAPKPDRKAPKPQPAKSSEPKAQPAAARPKPEPKVSPPVPKIATPQTTTPPEEIAQDDQNDAILAQITPDSDEPKEEVKKKKIANPPPPPIAKKPRPPQAKIADKKKPDPDKDKKEKSIDNLLISLVGDEEPVLQDLKPVKDVNKDAPQKTLDEILNAEINADLAEQETLDKDKSTLTPAPQIARFSDRLTISEQDALRQQLGQCWNVLAGARDAQDLIVQIRLTVRPDRTVSSARLINNNRYNSDGVYRAAADAALRAVRNPLCSPLALPADKYDQWKVITVRFDPRNMF